MKFNFLELNSRNARDIEFLYTLSREGLDKSLLPEHYSKIQLINKYTVAAIVSSPSLVSMVKREMRRFSNGMRIDDSDIERILLNEVLKREVIEDEKAAEAKRKVLRALSKKKSVDKPEATSPTAV